MSLSVTAVAVTSLLPSFFCVAVTADLAVTGANANPKSVCADAGADICGIVAVVVVVAGAVIVAPVPVPAGHRVKVMDSPDVSANVIVVVVGTSTATQGKVDQNNNCLSFLLHPTLTSSLVPSSLQGLI